MQQGTYRGNNVACSAAACGTFAPTGFSLIPGDWNADGRVNIVDLSEFMNSLAAGMADLDGDGLSDARDVSRFMTLFYGSVGDPSAVRK
jgi:hypothetical protein